MNVPLIIFDFPEPYRVIVTIICSILVSSKVNSSRLFLLLLTFCFILFQKKGELYTKLLYCAYLCGTISSRVPAFHSKSNVSVNYKVYEL